MTTTTVTMIAMTTVTMVTVTTIITARISDDNLDKNYNDDKTITATTTTTI